MTDDVTPFPKSVQLARGPKRYRRKVASTKTWQKLWDEKGGPCRVCSDRRPFAPYFTLHHLVFREDFGDDVAAVTTTPYLTTCLRCGKWFEAEPVEKQ